MLRPMEEMDLAWVREQRNRPECKDYFRQAHFLTEKQQEDWFKTTDMVSFVIWEKKARVGVVALSHIDNIARKCEFSIMIVPEHRLNGFGKKALFELLKHAFNDLNMRMVYSDVFENNPALLKYIHWGFTEYGKLPKWYYKNGEYIDARIIAITKDEYNSLQQTIPE